MPRGGQRLTSADIRFVALQLLASKLRLREDQVMPTYRWTCLACGRTNAADAHACISCSCPAIATMRQIQEARAGLSAQGKSAGEESAGALASELSAFEALVRPALILLFGWSPRCSPSQHENQI